jgi:hypothetical protein
MLLLFWTCWLTALPPPPCASEAHIPWARHAFVKHFTAHEPTFYGWLHTCHQHRHIPPPEVLERRLTCPVQATGGQAKHQWLLHTCHNSLHTPTPPAAVISPPPPPRAVIPLLGQASHFQAVALLLNSM